jgi:ligand-binding sensor domain-containing protein
LSKVVFAAVTNDKNKWRWLWGFVIVLVFCFLASFGGEVFSRLVADRKLPAGWNIIRPPREVSAMIEAGDVIWAGGQEGVFLIDRKKGVLIKKLNPLKPITYVRALYLDDKGSLWIGHQDGLTVYDGNTFRTYTEKDGLPDRRVNCLMRSSDGSLWVGTWGGAAAFNGKDWRVISKAGGLMEDMVNVMLEDSRGGLWFGHYVAPRGGISCLKDGKWQYFSITNGLPHNNVTSLMEDKSGWVWAGTGFSERGGSCGFVFSTDKWIIQEVLTKEKGLAGEKVRRIYQDKRGVYWFASEYDGILVFKSQQRVVLTEEDGLSNNEVKVIIHDADNNIWLGSNDGITVLNSSVLNSIP